MTVYVDVTPLYDLGMVGEMELIATLDGDLVVPDAVRAELTVEPAATNLERLFEDGHVTAGPDLDEYRPEAMAVLGADAPEVDVTLIAGILAERERATELDGDDGAADLEGDDGATELDGDDGEADLEGTDGAGVDVGLISDDRRLRRVADGLGATVSGTFGVVTQAALVDKYFSSDQAKRVIRRTDNHGVVTTGPLREQAIGDVGQG